MRTYHAKSYSQQARETADYIFWQYQTGEITYKGAVDFFSQSYKDPLIRQRAAKRFGRLRRKKGI